MADKLETTVTIAQNDAAKISNYVEVSRARYIGIYVPTLDSAALYLRASLDGGATLSGRIQKEDGSGDLTLATGTGGKFWTIPQTLPYRFIAIEASATQTTAARTFTILAKE